MRMPVETFMTMSPTEDEGPAISGIWTVTFPDLMEQAAKMIPELANSKEVGAGLYYFEVARRDDNSNLDFTISIGTLTTMIGTAVAGPKSSVKMSFKNFKNTSTPPSFKTKHARNKSRMRAFSQDFQSTPPTFRARMSFARGWIRSAQKIS